MSRATVEQSEEPEGIAPTAVTSPKMGEVDQPSVPSERDEAALSQNFAAILRQTAKPSQSRNNRKRADSVAVQQKSKRDALVSVPVGMFPNVDYSRHTDEELHNATVSALATYAQKREEADDYAYDVLIPALNQIIQRYKQQGRATSYRLNGCPTVEEYFESIGLNYSTVRSWKSRAQQRLLQAATDAGTKPAPVNTSDRDPVPHLNKTERKTLIEASHRAVEMVAAVEAGRDAKQEIAAFKVVMNAKRLDDIMQAHEQEPDYKSILVKLVQTVADMKASLPTPFVKAVHELTKPYNFKAALPPVPTQRTNGSGTNGAVKKQLQIAPIPQKPPDHMPLQPGKKYTARVHPQGGFGIYEPGSPMCLQKHPSQDSAWAAVEAVNATAAQALSKQEASALKEASAHA